MSEELIARLIVDHGVLMEYLRSQGEISFLSTIESTLPKVLLLASASDLEQQVQNILLTYYESTTRASEFAISFVKNKAISRQYHTYFDWGRRSANTFFGLFGERFKAKAKERSASDNKFAEAVKDFCELGDLRNQMVHENYASFVLEKTASEVYSLYKSSLYFVHSLPKLLEDDIITTGSAEST
jgi:hypothetical protein